MLRLINEAAVEGLTSSATPPTHEEDFLRSLRHSNEVFSAFKVHSMSTKMAERLIGEDGKLRSFAEWRKAVAPIARHQVGSWLQTEYDTAILRAHQAADWIEFERNKDIFPNLRWMPTTSPAPEAAHRVFWSKPVVLPIDDPFWSEHRPGDRWNCKCSLEATDEPMKPLTEEEQQSANDPKNAAQPGLEGNPVHKGLITDKHPYYPSSCSKCPFYKPKGLKGRLQKAFVGRVKDCHSCPYIDRVILEAKLTERYPLDKWEHTELSESGGYVVTEKLRIEESKVSKQELEVYLKEKTMAIDLARMGHEIRHLAEHNRPPGDRHDAFFDDVKADLKSTKSHNNIRHYGDKAFVSQGADMVIFRFEERTKHMQWELQKLKQKYPSKQVLYYYEDEQIIKEIK